MLMRRAAFSEGRYLLYQGDIRLSETFPTVVMVMLWEKFGFSVEESLYYGYVWRQTLRNRGIVNEVVAHHIFRPDGNIIVSFYSSGKWYVSVFEGGACWISTSVFDTQENCENFSKTILWNQLKVVVENVYGSR